MTKCKICKSSTRLWKKVTDDRFKNISENKYSKKKFNISICKNCKFAFVDPSPSKKFCEDFYKSLRGGLQTNLNLYDLVQGENKNFNNIRENKKIIKNLIQIHKIKNKHFLDIGCGYGFLSFFAKKHKFKTVMTDIASHERKISKQLCEQKVLKFDFNKKVFKKKFGVLALVNILEHVPNFNNFISRSHLALEKNGILILAVPNFSSLITKIFRDKDPYVCPPEHLNYFSKKNIELLMLKNNFTICKTYYWTYLPLQFWQNRSNKLIGYLLYFLSFPFFSIIDFFNLGWMQVIYAKKNDIKKA